MPASPPPTSLHVRESNSAAYHLYNETLGYVKYDKEKGYYADGEDAWDMRCYFQENMEEDEVRRCVRACHRRLH